jgi:uncharacterized membrane protein YoaT (DUF817 family)
METFDISAEVWLYPGKAAWHFVSVPLAESAEIRSLFGHLARGWGSLRVEVRVGRTSWKTSIFPDKKNAVYLLPLKADVRAKEGIRAGQKISLQIRVLI